MADVETSFGSDSDRLLGQLAEEFAQKLLRGDAVDVDEYCDRHPEYAETIREIHVVVRHLHDRNATPPLTANERVLGDYQLIREIGRGGMGVVYEAEQISLRRRVALKVLPFAAVLDQQQLQRFKNEAMAAAALRHPHIVGIYHFGCERAVYFYAMEYVDGQDVGKLLAQMRQRGELVFPGSCDNLSQAGRRSAGSFSSGRTVPSTAETRIATASSLQGSDGSTEVSDTPNDTARIPGSLAQTKTLRERRDYFRTIAKLGIQAAEALHFAHQRGILHRDIKPSNLILDRDGRLLIADFGLARIDGETTLTLSGDIVGTFRYMSPEQSVTGPITLDCRSDVYSLGVTLYELLTLQPVFPGCNHQELLIKRSTEEPIDPRQIDRAIPVDLETIILKSIAAQRDERYANAQEMADDLQRFLNNEPILAKRHTVAKRGWKFAQRHKSLTALFAMLVMLTLLFSVGIVNVKVGATPGDGSQEIKATTPSTTEPAPPAKPKTGSIPAPANWGLADSGRDFHNHHQTPINGDWHYMYALKDRHQGPYYYYPNFEKAQNAFIVKDGWEGSSLNADRMHPGRDGQMPVIGWKAPYSGHISVWYFFEDKDAGVESPHGGIEWFVTHGDAAGRIKPLNSGTIKNGGPRHTQEFFHTVEAGDMLFFGIGPGVNPLNDSTQYGVQIGYQSVELPEGAPYRMLADSHSDFEPQRHGHGNGDWRYLFATQRERDGQYMRYPEYDSKLEAYAVNGTLRSGTIGSEWMHTGTSGRMPILAWKSPVSGIVHLAGFFRDSDPGDPNAEDPQDGIAWFIDMNSTPEDPGELIYNSVENGGPAQDFNLYVDVRKGDVLYFGVDPLKNSLADSTVYNVTVYMVAEGLNYESVKIQPPKAEAPANGR